MLRYQPECDIVLVFRRQKGKTVEFSRLLNRVAEILSKQFPEARVRRGNKVAVTIGFALARDQSYSFDIVPSFEVNSPLQVAEVGDKRAYQGITTKWHEKYVRQVVAMFPQYKELVMLLKDWNNEHGSPFKSYHIELVVASAMEYRDIENADPLEQKAIECFKEIVSFVDRSPVYPVEWKYFDPDRDLEPFGSSVIMVDPANPRENLASKLSVSTLTRIRSLGQQAITLLGQGRYNEAFDPGNKVGGFWDSHEVSA